MSQLDTGLWVPSANQSAHVWWKNQPTPSNAGERTEAPNSRGTSLDELVANAQISPPTPGPTPSEESALPPTPRGPGRFPPPRPPSAPDGARRSVPRRAEGFKLSQWLGRNGADWHVRICPSVRGPRGTWVEHGYLLRRHLDPPNPPQTPSEKVLGSLGPVWGQSPCSKVLEVGFQVL